MADKIEIHSNGGEWAGLYLNGELQKYGDSYLCDEWLYERFGVELVYDSPWLIDDRTPRRTVAEINEAAEEIHRRKTEAAELRKQAAELEKRAKALGG